MDRWGDELFKDAYAFIPQSTVGDIMNERGIEYVYYTEGFEKLELLNQVHDSLWFQIPISAGFSEHARMLKDIANSLMTPLEWKGQEFIIPVEFGVGKNLGQCKENEIDLNGDIAKQLEALYG